MRHVETPAVLNHPQYYRDATAKLAVYLRFKVGHCFGKNQAIDFGSTNLVLSSQKWAKIMAIAPLMLAMNFEQPPSLATALIAIYREEQELCGRVGLTSVSQDELQCPQ